MFEKLELMKQKFNDLTQKISDPAIISNNSEWKKYTKEHSDLKPIIEEYEQYMKRKKSIDDNLLLLEREKDAEMREMIKEDTQSLKDELKESEEQLKILLLPKDENDTKNVILEIRGGAGGDESALFAHSLLRMYTMYAEGHKFKLEIIDAIETELGGLKECTAMIKGKNAFATFKYESGVHRVQRVPETESQGRIHTSTATVAVLPEMDEVEVDIDPKDLRIDLYRSSGAGGQHVNKTESAIRLTHLPTGIVVACQDERSQVQNKEKAFITLRAKLYDYYQQQKDAEYKQNRKSQVGTGDRSERIRTYNYPQGRVTDHRIGFTLYSLENFMNGDCDEMFTALKIADQQKKLTES